MISRISIESNPILREMLTCPHSLKYLSQNGRQPDDPETRGNHNDGCGMAFSKDGTVELHKRSRENAWDESYITLAKSVSAKIFLAHNRFASKGLEADETGAHPFSITAAGKTFALCHNGSIQDYMAEARELGISDSMIFLRKLIAVNGNNDAGAIAGRLEAIARETTYSSLCSFMMSADELYVWRIFNEKDPSKMEMYEKYYTLYMILRGDAALFSSEPLDEAQWMLLPNHTLLHLHLNEDKIAIDYHSLR